MSLNNPKFMLYFPTLVIEVVLVLVTILFITYHNAPKPDYLVCLALNDKNLLAPPIKEIIDRMLHKLIKSIYIKIKEYTQPAAWTNCLVIAFFIYSTLEVNNPEIAILFSTFFYHLGFFLILVKITYKWIENNSFKDNFPLLHSIILYLLVSLLVCNIYLFVINFFLICSWIFSLLKGYILKSNLINKLKDLKLSLEYKYFKSKDPKGPKSLGVFTTSEKKDKHKRALELKEKFFNNLTKNTSENPSGAVHASPLNSDELSFSQRKNWNETISIEKPHISVSDVLKNTEVEFKDYDIKEKKFKEIVVNIGKGKEGFYPNESISGFNESISVVNILKSNLKSNLKALKKIVENDLKK